MNWLNLNVHTLDSENFLGSEPIDRATWLCLLRYCIGQENSGRIANANEWADRKWQQLVRITKKEVLRACDLWRWDGSDLVVWGYPSEKEAEIQEKRERAKTNGEKGGRPKKTNVGTDEKPTLVISAKAEGEGKEKGREGKDALHQRWFPESLRDIAFVARWEEWEDHCQELSKPLGSGARRGQLMECERNGRDTAMKALQFSIANNRSYIAWDWQSDTEKRKTNGAAGVPVKGRV